MTQPEGGYPIRGQARTGYIPGNRRPPGRSAGILLRVRGCRWRHSGRPPGRHGRVGCATLAGSANPDRVGVTGLRPLPLPHHRTCGLPHPAVEPSGFKLPQDPMERINPNAGDGRCSRRCVRSDCAPISRPRPHYWPVAVADPSPPVASARSPDPAGYASVARRTCADGGVSSPPFTAPPCGRR